MSGADVKYCEACGFKNDKRAKFCDECGRQFGEIKEAPKEKPSELEEGSGLGVVSLIASFLGLCTGVGFIIAIITGLMTPNPKENKYAKIGIFIGSLGLIIPVTILSILGIMFGAFELTDGTDDLMWMLIAGIVFLNIAGASLYFFIRWARKPAS
jgi:hypothetical protein